MTAYLDHAATTPMLPAALEALTGQSTRVGNASSLHTSGRAARAVVEESRERIASVLGARPSEVVFTSGGTEADNLAVLGAAAAGLAAGRARVAASTVEHPAITNAVRTLGERALWLGVDADGVVTADALATLDASVSVASVLWVNNETGAIQPVPAVVDAARRAGALAHSDGVQALGHVPVSFPASGLDALSLSAHKVGGPVGIGALVVAPVPPDPSGQDRTLVLFEAETRASRASVSQALTDAGLVARSLLLARAEEATLALAEIDGFLPAEDPRLAALPWARRTILGAYAAPIAGDAA